MVDAELHEKGYTNPVLARIRIVLVRPRRGGNVGAVARAMKNLGLGDLVVVAPRTRVGAVGERMAAHARDVLAARRTALDLRSALDDCHLAVGTVGRETPDRADRARDAPVAPRALAPEIVAAARRSRVALVFGPEDHGLSNADLALCQRVIRIPTSPAYASLNLAQAVAICAYEVALAASRAAHDGGAGGASPQAALASTGPGPRGARGRREMLAPATSREREEMLAHLARALAAIGFLSAENPDHILRDVRSLFARAGLTRRDVSIWRGVARQALWAAGACATPRDRRSRG